MLFISLSHSVATAY